MGLSWELYCQWKSKRASKQYGNRLEDKSAPSFTTIVSSGSCNNYDGVVSRLFLSSKTYIAQFSLHQGCNNCQICLLRRKWDLWPCSVGWKSDNVWNTWLQNAIYCGPTCKLRVGLLHVYTQKSMVCSQALYWATHIQFDEAITRVSISCLQCPHLAEDGSMYG